MKQLRHPIRDFVGLLTIDAPKLASIADGIFRPNFHVFLEIQTTSQKAHTNTMGVPIVGSFGSLRWM